MAHAKYRKTKEQREAEAQALHDTLTAQVEALTETGEWLRFLKFLASFHTYSLTNVLLILAQRPDATTQVAGFRQWQAKGRQVRKGERSIKIRGYSTKKVAGPTPTPGRTSNGPSPGSRSSASSTRYPEILSAQPVDSQSGQGLTTPATAAVGYLRGPPRRRDSPTAP